MTKSILDLMMGRAVDNKPSVFEQMQADLARLERENDMLKKQAKLLIYQARSAARKLNSLASYYRGGTEISRLATEVTDCAREMERLIP